DESNTNCVGFDGPNLVRSKRYGIALTPGFTKSVSFYDPDVLVSYFNVPLWELEPVEVRSRAVPTGTKGTVPQIEADAFAHEGVTLSKLEAQLAEQGLAMIVMRNVTTRDHDDRQQPFNLSVPGGPTTTAPDTPVPPAKLYSVTHLE